MIEDFRVWFRLLRRRLARQVVMLPPPLFLAVLYATLVASGTGLLMLPFSQSAPVALGDCLFTATSAVTVTGLGVVDTGSDFTVFGQAVIALLIQLGGLGLMTFAVLVLSALGLPVGVSQQILLREDLNHTSIRDLTRLVATIGRVVLIFELSGAALLAVVFVPDYGLGYGSWSALFHSISAFNNAGFSLYPNSLSRYVGNPLVNIVIPALFIFGGIGYSVIADVWLHWPRGFAWMVPRRVRGTIRGFWQGLTLHSKLMIAGTATIVVLSVLMIGVLEWNNPATLGALGFRARLFAIWFQAVTPRTAGFNTIDTSGLHDSTALLVILLMVIGGGSTSTAGGIKVTTFIVLLMATMAFFKRRTTLNAYGRSIPIEEVLKVLALVTLSLIVVLSGIFLIALNHDDVKFIDIVFEVSSAFGTVGLSRGITPSLDTLGRAVIVAEMFIGRVGPLTLGFFLATRSTPRIRYPTSRVQFG